MRKIIIGSAFFLVAVTGACAAGTTTPPAVSSPSTAGSPTAPSPSPTPTPPTKAEDAADVKAALVDAKDLGDPWVKPKQVSRVGGKKGEICPGHVSAIRNSMFTATASTDLTRGKGAGTNIASYTVRTLPDADISTVSAAIKTDQKACARYRDAAGFVVTRTVEGPDSVTGGELIAGWTERIYYVKPRNTLAYARHYLVAQQGRVVTTASYAFLADKKDPEAKDFTAVTELLDKQLTKNASIFPVN